MSDIPFIGEMWRTVKMVWVAIRTQPRVRYLRGSEGFISITDESIIVRPEGKVINDGEKDTHIQDAWVEIETNRKTYRLQCEMGWDPEFIGQRIQGNGGQITVYPNFSTPTTNVKYLPEPGSSSITLIIQVWFRRVVKTELSLTWKTR